MLTHWKKLDNPDYIGAYAFQPNELKTLTISIVRRELIHGVDGKTEECTVVYFKDSGVKPLILNATNGKAIAKVTETPYIEEWAGKQIILGVEKVKAFGEVVDAVRVKKQKPAPAAPVEIICKDCKKPITAFESWSAQAIAAQSKSKYGVALCMTCAKARKEAAINENNENPD